MRERPAGVDLFGKDPDEGADGAARVRMQTCTLCGRCSFERLMWVGISK